MSRVGTICPLCGGGLLRRRVSLEYWVKECQNCEATFDWSKGEQIDVVTTDTTEPEKEKI